jgi:hypothetical protein
VHRALGASPEATIDLFETWLASVDPLQAWVTRAAWIPLWLDESLMREVDRAALEEVAALRQRRRATEIELLPGRSLAELETALAPLLPTFARLG